MELHLEYGTEHQQRYGEKKSNLTPMQATRRVLNKPSKEKELGIVVNVKINLWMIQSSKYHL